MIEDFIYEVCGRYGSYESQIYRPDEVLNIERGFLVCVTRKNAKKPYDQCVVIPFCERFSKLNIEADREGHYNYYYCTAEQFADLLSCTRYRPHSIWFTKQPDGRYLLVTHRHIYSIHTMEQDYNDYLRRMTK